MNEHDYAVIMAGGGGTRLWPLSRRDHPKQMLKLIGNESLFEKAVNRILPVIPPERIVVVTVAEQAAQLQAICPGIPIENYLIEPMPKGTASVVGLAAVTLFQRDPQAVMAVLTADHIIQNETAFQKLIPTAHELARKDYLVTLGITPTFPATGYGYIEMGNPLEDDDPNSARQVTRFREKPDEETAKLFLARGNYAWNSGMFFWKAETILGEFRRQMPALMDILQKVVEIPSPRHESYLYIKEWAKISLQTIDYGIMEAARNVVVLPAQDLGWNDVGSWDSLFQLLPQDENGNIWMTTRSLNLDTHGSLIGSEDPDKLIATIGVDNMIIIDTEDTLLICRKEDSQRVKKVVEQLLKTGRTNYL